MASGRQRKIRRACVMQDCTNGAISGDRCRSHGGGKRCAVEGCTSGAKLGGLCIAHGGGRRCEVEGCGKSAVGVGRCIAHGGGKPCKIPDCTHSARSRGLCPAHGGGTRCKVPDCGKHVVSGGLCVSHGGGRRCSVKGCELNAVGIGLCTDHGGTQKRKKLRQETTVSSKRPLSILEEPRKKRIMLSAQSSTVMNATATQTPPCSQNAPIFLPHSLVRAQMKYSRRGGSASALGPMPSSARPSLAQYGSPQEVYFPGYAPLTSMPTSLGGPFSAPGTRLQAQGSMRQNLQRSHLQRPYSYGQQLSDPTAYTLSEQHDPRDLQARFVLDCPERLWTEKETRELQGLPRLPPVRLTDKLALSTGNDQSGDQVVEVDKRNPFSPVKLPSLHDLCANSRKTLFKGSSNRIVPLPAAMSEMYLRRHGEGSDQQHSPQTYSASSLPFIARAPLKQECQDHTVPSTSREGNKPLLSPPIRAPSLPPLRLSHEPMISPTNAPSPSHHFGQETSVLKPLSSLMHQPRQAPSREHLMSRNLSATKEVKAALRSNSLISSAQEFVKI